MYIDFNYQFFQVGPAFRSGLSNRRRKAIMLMLRL